MKTKQSVLGLVRKTTLAVSVLAISTMLAPAHAAKFGVRVVDDNGLAVSGASVCIGLQGNYKQFAATFTDGQGQVIVDVPNVPLLVTVSKDRFTGMRTTEPARSFNLVKEVKLLEGVPGPRCRAGSILAEDTPGVSTIVVTDIAIFEGAGSVTLSPTVSGTPNQYRVSASEQFDDAKWESYADQISLADQLASNDKVYLQLRNVRGNSKAWLEARSTVMTVRLSN